MRRSLEFIIAGLLFSTLASAATLDIVFIAPTNLTMPLAEFAHDRLVGGILKDLGEAIAKKIGRNAQFKSIPSKRVSKILDAGEADGFAMSCKTGLAETSIGVSR